MHQLKDIARRMDDCHPRTAKRWWKKLDKACLAAGLPRVAPDVPGHGAHRWEDATADRLIELWKNFYKARGTTPQITRAKFAGKLRDGLKGQATLPLQFEFPIPQNLNVTPQKIESKKAAVKVKAKGRTNTAAAQS